MSISEYSRISDPDSRDVDKYIDMKSLDFWFWEFFSIDSMLFPERKMDASLSLIEIDIR